MFSIHNTETWTSVPKSILNIVNPLHFVIIMHFLYKVLYTFPKVLTRSICFILKTLMCDSGVIL